MTLKESLAALQTVNFFGLANDFPVTEFQEGARLLAQRKLEGCSADISKGKLRLVFDFGSARAVLLLKDAPESSSGGKVFFHDCFDVICGCGIRAERCRHQAGAAQGLWHALQMQAYGGSTSSSVPDIDLIFDALKKSESLTRVIRREAPVLKVVRPLTLTGILICVDETLPGMERVWSHPEAVQLPGSVAVPPEGYRSYALGTSQYSQLSGVFGISPLVRSWRTFDALVPDIEVQYQFSNGMILDMHQMLYHTLGNALKTELMPVDHYAYDHGMELLPYCIPAQAWHDNRLPAAILRIIRKADELKREGLQLSMVRGRDTAEVRRAMFLRQTVFVNSVTRRAQGGEWRLQCELQPAPNASAGEPDKGRAEVCCEFRGDLRRESAVVMLNFIVDTANRKLLFHPFAAKFHRLWGCLSDSATPGNSLALPSSLNRTVITGHDRINLTRHNLRQMALGDPSFEWRESTPVVKMTDCAPAVVIEPEGKFRFCARCKMPDGRTVSLLDFSRNIHELLQMLKTCWSYLSFNDEDTEVRRICVKRRQNLQAMNHAGAFAYAFNEVIDAVLSGSDTVDKAWEERKKKILAHMACLIDPDTRDAKKGKMQVAARLNFFLLEMMDNLHELLRCEFVRVETDVGPMDSRDYFTAFLRVMRALIVAKIAQTGGYCLMKRRVPVLEFFRDGVNLTEQDAELAVAYDDIAAGKAVAYEVRGFTADDLLAAFLPLQEQGFTVSFAGKPVTTLAQSDFNARFEIAENGESTANGAIDWFDLSPKFFVLGAEISAEAAMGLARGGVVEWEGRYYRVAAKALPTWKHLERFWERLGGRGISEGKKTGKEYFRLQRSSALELLLLRQAGVEITGGGEGWRELAEFFDTLDQPRQDTELPATIHAEMKAYQRSGVAWLMDLYRLRLGGILADDMGLGKTLQALAFLETLRARCEMGHVLILVPTSLTYNWMFERDKFVPELPMQVFNPKDVSATKSFLAENSHSALVCTYGLLAERGDFFGAYHWNIHIYDEAQNLKNITAQRTTAARALKAKRKFCLTGTPLENDLGEFYSLMDLAVPGCLGELKEFRARYVSRDHTPDTADIEYLKLTTKPLLMRRTKAEILKDLPEKRESSVVLPFETSQKKLYRDVALSWNEKVGASVRADGVAKSQLMMLTALLRLRQACSDPAALPGVKYKGEPPKVTLLADTIAQIVKSGESALVFTQFLSTFERIRRRFGENNVPCFFINGGMNRAEREKELSGFNRFQGGAVLVMTLKTGGTGLNLTKASYVFHVEPWWNPAVENQASDRAHRIGQTRPVQVYRYLMEDSVEQKIEILKRRKTACFDSLFSDAEGEAELKPGRGGITSADFEYLLGRGSVPSARPAVKVQ